VPCVRPRNDTETDAQRLLANHKLRCFGFQDANALTGLMFNLRDVAEEHKRDVTITWFMIASRPAMPGWWGYGVLAELQQREPRRTMRPLGGAVTRADLWYGTHGMVQEAELKARLTSSIQIANEAPCGMSPN